LAKKIINYLIKKIKKEGALHITLVDPENLPPESATILACESELSYSSAIMVGGTTLVSSKHLNTIVKTIKDHVNIPVILFPNNITGISKYADAIWFLSLLNSSDPYFIAGAQILAAPIIKKFNLETISLGYIIIGEGGAVGVIGKACAIPYDKPKLAAAYALAAQYFGMRFVYLEAGSGVGRTVPVEMVKMVKRMTEIPLIVGGGIKTGKQAEEIVKAGADIIVTSSVLEFKNKELIRKKIKEILKGIQIGVNSRKNLKN
jgi:phosphoglycerol geranylgeranyltransferase